MRNQDRFNLWFAQQPGNADGYDPGGLFPRCLVDFPGGYDFAEAKGVAHERPFRDCAVGAVPPLGAAYNIPTVVEDSLLSAPEVWFEAGDHEDLVHVRGAAFLSLLAGARHGSFAARH